MSAKQWHRKRKQQRELAEVMHLLREGIIKSPEDALTYYDAEYEPAPERRTVWTTWKNKLRSCGKTAARRHVINDRF